MQWINRWQGRYSFFSLHCKLFHIVSLALFLFYDIQYISIFETRLSKRFARGDKIHAKFDKRGCFYYNLFTFIFCQYKYENKNLLHHHNHFCVMILFRSVRRITRLFLFFQKQNHEKLFTSNQQIAKRIKKDSIKLSCRKKSDSCNATVSCTIWKDWKIIAAWKRAVQRTFISSQITPWQTLLSHRLKEHCLQYYETKFLTRSKRQHFLRVYAM